MLRRFGHGVGLKGLGFDRCSPRMFLTRMRRRRRGCGIEEGRSKRIEEIPGWNCCGGLGSVGGVPGGVHVEHLTGTRVSTEASLEGLLPLLPVIVVDQSGHDQAAAEAAAGTTGSAIATKKGERRYVRGDGHAQSNRSALPDADDDCHLQNKG